MFTKRDVENPQRLCRVLPDTLSHIDKRGGYAALGLKTARIKKTLENGANDLRKAWPFLEGQCVET